MRDTPTTPSTPERASERINVREELARVEAELGALKVDYEQFFLGVIPFEPIKLHREIKRQLRRLRKAPFKNSQMRFQLRMLESRYQTFNTYWQRVLREKEEGTYSRDVFKAELRERAALDEARAQTAQGAAERSMVGLFNSYKSALEKQTGKTQAIDFKAFQKSLVQRAKDFKQKHNVKKLTFKVVVKDGRVTVQAKAKS